MNTTRLLELTISLALVPTLVSANGDEDGGWRGARPDGHAPIGVMGEHTHAAGEWMISYRYMRMRMEGSLDGTSRIRTSEILDPDGEGFMVTPTSMDMEMHMVGLVHAPTGDLTLMGMVPHHRKSMDHVTRMGGKFTTESEGVGDVSLAGLWVISRFDRQRVHLNLGLSLPTGSIDEKDETPAGNVRLPYPMQLGSGTVDLLPGITYLGQTDAWSWGGQAMATLRTGENDNEYTLGNAYQATGWGARKLGDWVSASARLDYRIWEDIEGEDPEQNPNLVPTADPDLRAGQRLDLLVGLNLYGPEGALHNHRLAIEYGQPVHQDLDGPQLETDSVWIVGYQFAWGGH